MMGLDICATCGHRKDQHKPACVAFASSHGLQDAMDWYKKHPTRIEAA